MKNNDRFTAILLGALGIYISIQGYFLGLGIPQKPKPGFLVFWVGIILTGLSALLISQTFYSKEEDEKKSLWQGINWKRVVKLIIILVGYILVFQWLGFIISTFFLLFLLFKNMGSQKWHVTLILSMVSTLLSFFIFGYFLEVQFPLGILKKIF